MIHYILQIFAFQLVFLLVYDVFLKRETFFTWNRVYLLVTPILSLILPLIKIEAIRRQIPEDYIVQLPAVILGDMSEKSIVTTEATHVISTIGMVDFWYVGMVVTFLILLLKLYKLYTYRRKGTIKIVEGVKVIVLSNTDAAFTFLNFIFIGKDLTREQKKSIIEHEKVHATQYHTLDLLFFEILRIIFWFNPFIYIYQNRMSELQEYIADAHVAQLKSKRHYYQSLLSQVFQTNSVSFTNTFFKHSFIKNRIIMIQKTKSKKIVQLRYLLLAPLVLGMLVYTSCSDDKNTVGEANQVAERDTEVMAKINELAEVIMKKGNLNDEEVKALRFLAMESREGDSIYESVQSYLDDPNGRTLVDGYVRETEKIPFAVIDKVPVYPGCEGLSNEEAKQCFTQNVSQFIVNKFNTKVAPASVTGRQRIVVDFVITKEGTIANVKANADYQELIDEASRVINQLPTMQPGENDGKKVAVKYALPILFEIE